MSSRQRQFAPSRLIIMTSAQELLEDQEGRQHQPLPQKQFRVRSALKVISNYQDYYFAAASADAGQKAATGASAVDGPRGHFSF